eukprot:ANDGO_06819.mRNA.1 hypothetical protein
MVTEDSELPLLLLQDSNRCDAAFEDAIGVVVSAERNAKVWDYLFGQILASCCKCSVAMVSCVLDALESQDLDSCLLSACSNFIVDLVALESDNPDGNFAGLLEVFFKRLVRLPPRLLVSFLELFKISSTTFAANRPAYVRLLNYCVSVMNSVCEDMLPSYFSFVLSSIWCLNDRKRRTSLAKARRILGKIESPDALSLVLEVTRCMIDSADRISVFLFCSFADRRALDAPLSATDFFMLMQLMERQNLRSKVVDLVSASFQKFPRSLFSIVCPKYDALLTQHYENICLLFGQMAKQAHVVTKWFASTLIASVPACAGRILALLMNLELYKHAAFCIVQCPAVEKETFQSQMLDNLYAFGGSDPPRDHIFYFAQVAIECCAQNAASSYLNTVLIYLRKHIVHRSLSIRMFCIYLSLWCVRKGFVGSIASVNMLKSFDKQSAALLALPLIDFYRICGSQFDAGTRAQYDSLFLNPVRTMFVDLEKRALRFPIRQCSPDALLALSSILTLDVLENRIDLQHILGFQLLRSAPAIEDPEMWSKDGISLESFESFMIENFAFVWLRLRVACQFASKLSNFAVLYAGLIDDFQNLLNYLSSFDDVCCKCLKSKDFCMTSIPQLSRSIMSIQCVVCDVFQPSLHMDQLLSWSSFPADVLQDRLEHVLGIARPPASALPKIHGALLKLDGACFARLPAQFCDFRVFESADYTKGQMEGKRSKVDFGLETQFLSESFRDVLLIELQTTAIPLLDHAFSEQDPVALLVVARSVEVYRRNLAEREMKFSLDVPAILQKILVNLRLPDRQSLSAGFVASVIHLLEKLFRSTELQIPILNICLFLSTSQLSFIGNHDYAPEIDYLRRSVHQKSMPGMAVSAELVWRVISSFGGLSRVEAFQYFFYFACRSGKDNGFQTSSVFDDCVERFQLGILKWGIEQSAESKLLTEQLLQAGCYILMTRVTADSSTVSISRLPLHFLVDFAVSVMESAKFVDFHPYALFMIASLSLILQSTSESPQKRRRTVVLTSPTSPAHSSSQRLLSRMKMIWNEECSAKFSFDDIPYYYAEMKTDFLRHGGNMCFKNAEDRYVSVVRYVRNVVCSESGISQLVKQSLTISQRWANMTARERAVEFDGLSPAAPRDASDIPSLDDDDDDDSGGGGGDDDDDDDPSSSLRDIDDTRRFYDSESSDDGPIAMPQERMRSRMNATYHLTMSSEDEL